ncbi:MAG: gfo/Idh/MocA family oxidoreductase, partial [Candidatus Latescibacteria bacterium]|nr:gfo/Idh/MocA family oxidoreductase [Candidatus Latescibacterota bacterium]
RPSRAIRLMGTEGEIQGVFEDSKFVIRHIDPRPGHEYSEEEIDLKAGGDMHGAFGGHGGGDLRLVSDFVGLVREEETSISCTRIEDSVNGHLMGFCADRAMEETQVITLDWKG